MQSRRLFTFWNRYDLPVVEKALGLEASKDRLKSIQPAPRKVIRDPEAYAGAQVSMFTTPLRLRYAE